MNKKLFAALFSVSILLTGCGKDDDKKDEKRDVDPISTMEIRTTSSGEAYIIITPEKEYILVASFDKQTPYELLVNFGHQVNYTDYGDLGYFVTGINGLESDDENYWAFYVNGEYGMESASKLELERGATVTWKYEKIDSAAF